MRWWSLIKLKWMQYRYRFVPWIIFNMKERSVRSVSKDKTDKLIADAEVNRFLCNFLSALENDIDDISREHPKNHEHVSFTSPENKNNVKKLTYSISGEGELYKQNLITMKKILGFTTERRPSTLPHGGIGVFVTAGNVPKGTVVSIYPGSLYQSHDPILFQSIANPFIFRCIDGVLIDGNDKNISKYIFRSCGQRDRHGPYLTCDMSWLTQFPVNPLAVGQYVNNQSKRHPANVAYQEYDIPSDFPFHLLKYIPNVCYAPQTQWMEDMNIKRLTRVVVLVSTRDILEGEELFSSYFTVVQ